MTSLSFKTPPRPLVSKYLPFLLLLLFLAESTFILQVNARAFPQKREINDEYHVSLTQRDVYITASSLIVEREENSITDVDQVESPRILTSRQTKSAVKKSRAKSKAKPKTKPVVPKTQKKTTPKTQRKKTKTPITSPQKVDSSKTTNRPADAPWASDKRAASCGLKTKTPTTKTPPKKTGPKLKSRAPGRRLNARVNTPPSSPTNNSPAPAPACSKPDYISTIPLPAAAKAKLPTAEQTAKILIACAQTGAAKGFEPIFYTGGTHQKLMPPSQWETLREDTQRKNKYLQLKWLLTTCGQDFTKIQATARAAAPQANEDLANKLWNAVRNHYWIEMSRALALTMAKVTPKEMVIIVPDGMTTAPKESYYALYEAPLLQKMNPKPKMRALEVPSGVWKDWAL